jgi:hypothetical protein
LLAFVGTAPAQDTINGKLDIQYNTKQQANDDGSFPLGVRDQFKMDIVAVSTLVWRGSVEYQPGIYGTSLGLEKQPGVVTYSVDVGVRNPADPSQEKMIGRLVGGVQIDRKGMYDFEKGTVRIGIDPAGKAAGFESAFRGRAAGKPPKTGSLLEQAKNQAITLRKQAQGKTIALIVTNFDRMAFQNLVLAAGPVKTYPETQVNGEMLYDYERSAWYFHNVTLTFQMNGKEVVDTLSGNIKWEESPQRKSNGEGKYTFDIRVNEPAAPAPNESQVFSAQDDEAAFFTVDNTLAGLTGTAKYKDTLRDEETISSAVTIALTSNKLSKQETVALFKLIWLVSIVPINSD